MRSFDSVLIANRGEIACRIIRTVQSLGLRAIAVYSEADRDALHMRLADDALAIGPAAADASYLDIERVISAAQTSGAGAVHPGYGFLSENAAFAQAISDAGLIFVGPSPDAIRVMGDKAAAKRAMLDAGVPCVPGYQGDDQSDATLTAQADRIGYPLLVKASAGGGGRGMRRVETGDALLDALASARSEAERSFGKGDLILEKAILAPRHVEFQVIADAHGTVLHVGERDCSVQRRHQKVIEEAPCPTLSTDLRDAMAVAAIKATRAVDYQGAGTVEFLLDSDGAFYFIEMNTRLQVEHPVTEAITGLDLVALQLKIADGEPLRMSQHDIAFTGHAIEARLYAEDPVAGFLPSVGKVHRFKAPEGPGIRCDTGIATGDDVTAHYDPMLAKVIAWGQDRETARARLGAALARLSIFGIQTNRRFLQDILATPEFIDGTATTDLLSNRLTEIAPALASAEQTCMAAVLALHTQRDAVLDKVRHQPRELLGWSSGEPLWSRLRLLQGTQETEVEICALPNDRYRARLHDETFELCVSDANGMDATVEIDGKRRRVQYLCQSDCIYLAEAGNTLVFLRASSLAAQSKTTADQGPVKAPMHGTLVEVRVTASEQVARGALLAVLEAMKMQHPITAPRAGRITAVHRSAGDQVSAGTVLFDINPEDS